MGARLTVFENRSSVEIMKIIRVHMPPDRADQYLTVAKIEPGHIKEIVTKSLCYKDTDPENPSLLMGFMGSKFRFLLPMEVVNSAKIICDIDESGELKARIIKTRCRGFHRLRDISFCSGS